MKLGSPQSPSAAHAFVHWPLVAPSHRPVAHCDVFCSESVLQAAPRPPPAPAKPHCKESWPLPVMSSQTRFVDVQSASCVHAVGGRSPFGRHTSRTPPTPFTVTELTRHFCV